MVKDTRKQIYVFCLELGHLATKPPRGLLDRTPVLPPAPISRRPEYII